MAHADRQGGGDGVHTYRRFAEVVSTNNAKILGPCPRKGVLAAGSNADIVLFDPLLIRKRLSLSDSLGVEHNVHDGSEVHGWPVSTIRREGHRGERKFPGDPGRPAPREPQDIRGGAGAGRAA
jgi:dihydropyrimidinase